MGQTLRPKIRFFNLEGLREQNLKLLKTKLIYLMHLIKEISKILGELGAVGPVGLFKQPS